MTVINVLKNAYKIPYSILKNLRFEGFFVWDIWIRLLYLFGDV